MRTKRTTTEEQLRAVTLGELVPLTGPIQIVDYTPSWPRIFEHKAERIQAMLGDRVLLLEHVGSTSVPGLVAKPIIDMLLVVADSADEPAYVPALEAAGYVLRIRLANLRKSRLILTFTEWDNRGGTMQPDSRIIIEMVVCSCPKSYNTPPLIPTCIQGTNLRRQSSPSDPCRSSRPSIGIRSTPTPPGSSSQSDPKRVQ